MSIMDGSVTAEEQYAFAERLITMAAQLQGQATAPVADTASHNPGLRSGAITGDMMT